MPDLLASWLMDLAAWVDGRPRRCLMDYRGPAILTIGGVRLPHTMIVEARVWDGWHVGRYV